MEKPSQPRLPSRCPATLPSKRRAAVVERERSAGEYRRPDSLFGPDRRTAFCGISLSAGLTIVFLFLLSTTAPPAFIAVGALLWTSVFATWLLASTTDPGVIPITRRVDGAEAVALCASLHPRCTLADGQSASMRWCYHCRIYRPPRAVHCPDCNVCVLRFDHHCPWISQCVGQRNYGYFYAFLMSILALCLYVGTVLTVFAFGFLPDWNRRALVQLLGGARDAIFVNGILIVLVAIGVAIGTGRERGVAGGGRRQG
jgi:hypothetical protein